MIVFPPITFADLLTQGINFLVQFFIYLLPPLLLFGLILLFVGFLFRLLNFYR